MSVALESVPIGPQLTEIRPTPRIGRVRDPRSSLRFDQWIESDVNADAVEDIIFILSQAVRNFSSEEYTLYAFDEALFREKMTRLIFLKSTSRLLPSYPTIETLDQKCK